MARDPKYDILFDPVQIGPKIMRNRFYQAPHCTGFGSDFPGSQAALRGVKAEGGWGLVNTEYCSIHPESDDRPWVQARLWDESDVHNLSLMCDQVHVHGSLAGVELNFSGPHHSGYESRQPARGVSQLPSVSSKYITRSCYAMDKDDIRELQAFYVAAARRARSAGFDLVLIYGAETIGIPQQFLMPYFNKRTDEYGGCFENRARFFRELLELLRDAVGSDCAVGARVSIDTLSDDDSGIRVAEDGVRFIEHVDHLVDLWDVQVGPPSLLDGTDAIASSHVRRENFQKPWVDQIRPYTNKPIAGVGRFTSADTMAEVIRSRQLDLIGAARPSIADPFLPMKIEQGRLDEIRECIGCNICISRFNQGGQRLVCTQNPTAGEEYRRGWHPEQFTRAANADKDVLVVGAGPAGMECAVVLGRRGMSRVHLVDAASEIGGALRWISKLPGLAEWSRVISYRSAQLDKLHNVEFVPNKRLDASGVLEYGADLVVIATGSAWATDGLNAFSREIIRGVDAGEPYFLTPEQIMVEGKSPPGDRVIVYDCDGYFMGASLAEKLATEGRRVTLITPYATPGPYLAYTLEQPHVLRVLNRLGVEIVTGHLLHRIEVGKVVGNPLSSPDRTVVWDADSVVLVTQRVSSDALYHELKANQEALEEAGIVGLYRIGDCLEPRLIADCVFDGHRLAREIDTEDPRAPRPFLRENLVLTSLRASVAREAI